MFLCVGAGELQAVIAVASWSLGVLPSINGVTALAALHPRGLHQCTGVEYPDGSTQVVRWLERLLGDKNLQWLRLAGC